MINIFWKLNPVMSAKMSAVNKKKALVVPFCWYIVIPPPATEYKNGEGVLLFAISKDLFAWLD